MRTSRLDRFAALGVVAVLGGVLFGATGTHAAFLVSTGNSGNTYTSIPDWKPPIISRAIMQKSEGGIAGYVRASGSYRVYAGVVDDPSSNPPAGIASVVTNVSTLTAGATALTMTAAANTIGGLTYTHQSAAQTVAAGKAAASYNGTVTSSDAVTPANTSAAFPFSAVVDNTAPSPSSITTTNAGGTAGAGKADVGDTITYTWNEPIDPWSIISGWDGTGQQSVEVQIVNKNNGQGGDQVSIWNANGTVQLPLGLVKLAQTGYVSSTVTFGGPTNATPSRMTWNATTGAITVTLAPPDGGASANKVATTSNMTWTPSSSAFDRAGNPASTTVWTEATATIKF